MPQIVAFMTPFPYSIDIDAPLAEAQAFMAVHHIRHLPVMQGSVLAGILTARDAQRGGRTVGDACVREPYVVAASAPVDEVAEAMAERHIGSALVTREGKLVGVFTASDACRTLARVLRDRFAPPPPDEAA